MGFQSGPEGQEGSQPHPRCCVAGLDRSKAASETGQPGCDVYEQIKFLSQKGAIIKFNLI